MIGPIGLCGASVFRETCVTIWIFPKSFYAEKKKNFHVSNIEVWGGLRQFRRCVILIWIQKYMRLNELTLFTWINV